MPALRVPLRTYVVYMDDDWNGTSYNGDVLLLYGCQREIRLYPALLPASINNVATSPIAANPGFFYASQTLSKRQSSIQYSFNDVDHKAITFIRLFLPHLFGMEVGPIFRLAT